MHYLQLEKDGLTVSFKDGVISNDGSKLGLLFNNSLSAHTMGNHSIDEIWGGTYYLSEGETDMAKTEDDAVWNQLAWAFLRQAQLFSDSLWEIRDNSVYVRDGFLYVFKDQLEKGCTFKVSVSKINSFADGRIIPSVFSEKELVEKGAQMQVLVRENYLVRSDLKNATEIQHYKGSGLDRKTLARTYVEMARFAGAVPMKLLLFCTAFEALVSTTTMELSHRVSERIALLLGEDGEAKKQVYLNVKKCYDVRSKVAHGDFIKGKSEDMAALSVTIDGYLRRLLELTEPFDRKSNEIDEFFLQKMF